MTLRAVIFDYGEVLSLAANEPIRKEMIQVAGLPQDVFEKYYWAYRSDHDQGVLNGRAYWEKIASSAGTRFTSEQIDRFRVLDARMWMDVNESMLEWHRDLKRAGMRTAILSNMGEDVLDGIRRDFSWVKDFDELIWSCEVGSTKPDPAIYSHTLNQLGIRPEEGLFIDNLEENIRAAEAAGLHGIVFENIEQLGSEILRRNFDIPLPGAGDGSGPESGQGSRPVALNGDVPRAISG